MFINWQVRELNLKIVYYGPAQSGKTTNLEQIHARVNPCRRGELISLKSHEDRNLYFDFVQLELGKIGGLSPKIHLYSVPGQNHFEASRKLVLRGADGVVFVADSAAERTNANIESWEFLQAGLPAANLPIVLQFNKRDLPTAMPLPLLKTILKVNNYATFESIATIGVGVIDTLKAIINDVVIRVQPEVA